MKKKKKKMKKRAKTIRIIAFWTVFSIIPGAFLYIKNGVDTSLLHIAIIEWIYYLLAVICFVGLCLVKEWARKLAIWLFGIYFVWAVYVSYYLSGPSFGLMIEQQSAQYLMNPELLKKIVTMVLISYFVWPIIVIFFLSHPRVKILFDPKSDPSEEED